MRRRLSIRMSHAGALLRRGGLALTLACAPALAACAQTPPPDSAAPVVLDSVVAVVNHQVILSSDLDQEIRLSVLDPNNAGQTLTRAHALEQLISRALIEQQIGKEDAQAAMPSQAEVDARLQEIRRELPACVREKCATDAGWAAFLAAHHLTPERVQAYLRYRLQILRFIEQRFRPGIRIEQQQIAAYYNNTLLPQYAPGESVPPLAQVAPRIEEILLEQQVNALFDDWLANLRKEGDVEVLDPSLAPSLAPSPSPSLDSAAQNAAGGADE
jgi:peptidyl-prolyl cis-trans isomerase SurA